MIAFENPALSLRAALTARFPRAMVRWDESGRALLVTDAPRRGMDAPDALVENGLAYYDLPQAAYEAMRLPEVQPGDYAPGFFQEQATLAAILAETQQADPLKSTQARRALSAAARGEVHVRAFLAQLRMDWAIALRLKNPEELNACRLAARVAACWLYQKHGIGVPGVKTAKNM